MKLKGINVFEQHVEKIVLGVAVVGAGGLVAWQFINTPEVKVGSRSVAPRDVDPLLVKKAEDLGKRLEGAGIEINAEGVALAAPSFDAALKGDVAPAKALARTAPNFNGRLVKGGSSAQDVWYYVPTLPALQMRGVQETADALTAEAAAEAKKASAVLAARADFQTIDGPKDVVWTTPFARIDLKKLRAELAASAAEATPPKMAIPGVWYQETPYVVDVVFERREKGANGDWGAPAVVPVFASRTEELNFRGRIAGASADLRDEVFSLLGNDDNQKEILQATFYDTVNGSFVSPAVIAEAGPDATGSDPVADLGAARRRLQLQTQLQQKQRRAESLRADLEKLGGIWDEEQERKNEEERKRDERERKESEQSGGKTGGGAGGRGPGGGPGGSMSGKNNPSGEDGEKDAKRRAAERKSKSLMYKRAMQEIAAIEKELGVQVTASPNAPKAPAAPKLASLDELLVWGHDLEVQPGSTYQYRCVARVYNPFFGKGNQLVKEQDAAGLSAAFTIDSVASEWSSELTVSPDVRFFVTKAMVGDGSLGMGSAQIEVYKLLGGQWRRGEVSVQPGERIGRVDDRGGASVDFSTQYFLLDVVEDLDSERSSGATRDRRPGIVVIGSIGGDDPEIRIPAVDLGDVDRMRLRAQAEASKAAGQGSGAPATKGS
jgi:hypothetical protein